MQEAKLAIGEKVRNLRSKKGLSIAAVAEKSGLPPATINGIEEQTISPPLGQIVSLAGALRVSLGELFGDSGDAPFCIARSDNKSPVTRFGSTAERTGNYRYESLGLKKQNRHMEPFLVTLNPGKEATEPNQHNGEEILYVLEGQVEVSLDGHTDILGPGDSIYYDSSLPHLVSCHGDTPAKLFAVIYAQKDIMIF